MKTKPYILMLLSVLLGMGCGETTEIQEEIFYLGGDLSYVNELIDCGAEFRLNGESVNPYQLFGDKGANISRIRLWHSPDWKNGYSAIADVALAIQRSKDAGMSILLDFHYSDTWADPQHQVIPQAWEDIDSLEILVDSLYDYTYQTLKFLHSKGLTPEFVQVGNEVNIEIMQDSANMVVDTINWSRNIQLLNAGIQAVGDFSDRNNVNIGRMIHIAQPENALWWFDRASKYGLRNYEWMGISYYPKWSSYGLDDLHMAIDSLINTYKKDFMIVETAYPYTLNDADQASNILGEDALIEGYPATEKGQSAFLERLIDITKRAGGKGVIYWEPAWVSSSCNTLWGKGSHWDNATFFDASNNNEALSIFSLFARTQKE